MFALKIWGAFDPVCGVR